MVGLQKEHDDRPEYSSFLLLYRLYRRVFVLIASWRRYSRNVRFHQTQRRAFRPLFAASKVLSYISQKINLLLERRSLRLSEWCYPLRDQQ